MFQIKLYTCICGGCRTLRGFGLGGVWRLQTLCISPSIYYASWFLDFFLELSRGISWKTMKLTPRWRRIDVVPSLRNQIRKLIDFVSRPLCNFFFIVFLGFLSQALVSLYKFFFSNEFIVFPQWTGSRLNEL